MATGLKLKDIYSKDEKQIAKEQIELNVESAQLQVNTDIFAAKKRVNDLKRAYEKVVAITPFNPAAVINAKNDLEDAEKLMKDLEELKSLF